MVLPDTLLIDYQNGMSFKRMEEKYKIPSTSIYRHLKTNQLLNNKRKSVRCKNYDCEPYLTFKKLYIKEKLSICKIAEICNCSISKVHKYLQKNNLTRSNSESRILYSERNIKNARFFQIIDSSEKAYWLGFLMADGSIKKNGYQVVLSIATKDEGHLHKFANIFGTNVKNYKRQDGRTNKEYYISTVNICSKVVVDDLCNLGMCNNKTKRLSSIVFQNIPNEYKNSFILGYFDGDGSARGNRISFVSWSKEFIMLIGNYIDDILKIDNFHIYEHKNVFTICWYKKENLRKFYKWMYDGSNVFLLRKMIDVKKFTN